MYKAARQNKRFDLISQVLGFSAALENTMDRALGTGGKKQYLKKWVDAVMKVDSSQSPKKGISRAAQQFLSGGLPGLIPVIKKKKAQNGE